MSEPLFVNAAHCRPVPRPPVWMMRQAGRYLPSYREIRADMSFQEMCRNPDVATAITLQPIEQLGMDAAIMFSDILVTAEATGLPLTFTESKGPCFPEPVRSAAAVESLQEDGAVDRLDFVIDEIRLLKKALDPSVALVGFAGAPFTVCSYMIEGVLTKDLRVAKRFLFTEERTGHALLEKMAGITVAYLDAQIRAGVDAVQIFDTWAGALSWTDFQEYSLRYIRRIIEALDNPAGVPVIVFCRGSSLFAPLLQDCGANVISLDWPGDLPALRRTLPANIAVQGNLDPHLLYAPDQRIETQVKALLTSMRGERGFIVNLGHGILPDMQPEKVKLVVDLVKSSGGPDVSG